MAGLCLGAYPLAYAGILDGHRAVTHWRFARDFRARFPRVELDPKALYIDDRNRITSGGIAAGNDCCLYLFRKHEGAAAANDVARNMLIPPVRMEARRSISMSRLPARHRPRASTSRCATPRNI